MHKARHINRTCRKCHNLRYPGQYFDEESNLNYNYQRSYQFGQGRYSQSDPIGLDGGWSRFGYVGGNPLGFVDPEGLQASDSGSSSLFPGPSACVYYEKKCNESCGEDKYACEAKQCCESFGGNMLSSCTRQCLITRDTKTCSKLKGKARNTCRQNAHYFCYAACFNAPDAISGWLGLFPPAACKGAASSIGGMW